MQPMPAFHDERDWFFEKRLGLFVHWGLYALGGWHEQEMWRKHRTREQYAAYLEQFNPVDFNPDVWLDLAEEAGMQYITVTAKHCDGFCLWNTAYTDYNIMNTPYRKDIIGMLAEACQRRSMPLCLYYSVVDWHHPNYPHQGKMHEMAQPFPGDEPDLAKYIHFVKNQIRELCTQYGEIHGIWWDANRLEVYDPTINDMIRELQPKAVINNRGFDEGDFGTPERDYGNPTHGGQTVNRQFIGPTEACQAIGMHSWGYKTDEDFYSSKYLIQSIARALSMGGNYLLNVGPKPDGSIQEEFAEQLRQIGRWFFAVREAYEHTEPASYLIENEEILVTRRENTLYLHLLVDPKGTSFELIPMTVVPKQAMLLNNRQQLEARRDQGTRHWQKPLEYVRLRGVPVHNFYDQVMVIKLEYSRIPASWIGSIQENTEKI